MTMRERVETVVAENPLVVAKYKSGQVGVAGFFVGEVVKSANVEETIDVVQVRNTVCEVLERR